MIRTDSDSEIGRVARSLRSRSGASLLTATYATIFVAVIPGQYALILSAQYIALVFFLAATLLLPRALGWVVLASGSCLVVLLEQVSRAKSALTQLPLTLFDLQIAAANPRGLIESVQLPAAVQAAALLLSAALVIVLSWLTISATRQLYRDGPTSTFKHPSVMILAIIVIGLGVKLLTSGISSEVRTQEVVLGQTWSPSGLTSLSRQLGIVPFLIYLKANEDAEGSGGLMFGRESGYPPQPFTIDLKGYVHAGAQPLPNIVVVLMESTFDPNRAFNLSKPDTSRLFVNRPETVAKGIFRVNAVGGGTWITEFETITGLDARLFGFAGYYTHAAVSPFMHNSFVTYLGRKGYRTTAYYPVPGNFYNARTAYHRYGFDRFLDHGSSIDRSGLSGSSWSRSDVAEAARFVSDARANQSTAPSFSYVVLIENHSPHQCENFVGGTTFTTNFRDTKDFGRNCELNEYLRRTNATAAALAKIEAYLRQRQLESGRPWLLAAFGDHQPNTFTGSDWSQKTYNYEHLRTPHSLHETFFRIEGTAQLGAACCRRVIPSFLLPTLLSGAVAKSVDDLYLPVNIYLNDHCGPDIMPGTYKPLRHYAGRSPTELGKARPGCANAVSNAVAHYRHGDIVASPN